MSDSDDNQLHPRYADLFNRPSETQAVMPKYGDSQVSKKRPHSHWFGRYSGPNYEEPKSKYVKKEEGQYWKVAYFQSALTFLLCQLCRSNFLKNPNRITLDSEGGLDVQIHMCSNCTDFHMKQTDNYRQQCQPEKNYK